MLDKKDSCSRPVVSNQDGPHEKLVATVKKHLSNPFLRPIAAHTEEVFLQFKEKLCREKRPIILDACCGVGDSTRKLAVEHPEHIVIGIDKSANRLSREREAEGPNNILLLRADLNDFYRLMVSNKIMVDKHYLLYPNPWPKSAHLKRRWHGAPVFPSLLAVGGHLTLRSNWFTYVDEFGRALDVAGYRAEIQQFLPQGFMTPFEKKYHESGQTLWQLEVDLRSAI